MNFDNFAAVKAFIDARIKMRTEQVVSTDYQDASNAGAVEELLMLKTLCAGLERQSELIEKSLNLIPE